jgi:hypothetical protein
MKPINICPVKVGQWVRYAPEYHKPTHWMEVKKIVQMGKKQWRLTCSGYSWWVRYDDMCEMEVKNEAD